MTELPPEPVDSRKNVSGGHERVSVLTAFLREEEERAVADQLRAESRHRNAKIRRRIVSACWLGIAYVWVGTPGWLTVAPPPEQSVASEELSLRLNVFLQSQQVEAYLQARGRLPYVLEETGPPFQGMQYRRKDNRFYEIRGASDQASVIYESTQPAMEFVTPAAGLLDRPFAGEDSGQK